MISDIKRINHNIEFILINVNNNNYYKEYINVLSNEIINLRKKINGVNSDLISFWNKNSENIMIIIIKKLQN